MAGDHNHHAQRPREDSGYFESFDPSSPVLSDSKPYRPVEAQGRENMTVRSRDSSNAAQPSPPLPRGTSTSHRENDAASDISHSGVTAELIAEITEKVKREIFESLGKTGKVDDIPKSIPLQRSHSSSTSSPPPTSRRIYTPPSPAHTPKQTSPTMESAKLHPISPLEKPQVRFSNRELPRPAMSAVDQKWGKLFDADGNHTPMLGQFLRGLANHLIRELEPTNSIVVTPLKMAAFYSSHPLERETYGFTTIFRAQMHEQISQLYQELGCEHHLVQDQPNSAPTVPALTPKGFCQWMIIQIKAYPDEETARLNKILQAWPIDADGEKPERLPKQLSRHLLPNKEDKTSRKSLDIAIKSFLDNLERSTKRQSSITSPQLSRHTSENHSRPVDVPPPKLSPAITKSTERGRTPYASAPLSSVSDPTEESIRERERKPYVAHPGNGKIFVEPVNTNAIPTSRARARSSSRSDKESSYTNDEIRHKRTQSDAYKGHEYMFSRRPPTRRNGSPPFQGHRHSTSDIGQGPTYAPQSSPAPSNVGSQTFSPGSYSRSGYNSSFPPPPPPIEIRGSRRDEYSHRRSDIDPRITAEFSSPRDAERWDRLEDLRASEDGRYARSYDSSGSGFEDFYRTNRRSSTHDAYRGY
ncbi:hypothetical protein F5884DRAFT_288843 [Xylogone sp. PMI_703]|nr:hypothetical protein F5884DRAFT_288843 [Xylogone sp. PMI_703]